MMTDPRPAPEGVDPTTPNVARMYDYYLGGKDNFAADREAAQRILKVFPDTRLSAVENRAFLARAVDFLVKEGVRQIVDIGSGLPTQGNVHEIAHRAAPGTHVVYVDYDPVVVTHARAILGRGENVSVLQADFREPDVLLPALEGLVDLDRPVAFLLFAILHFIPDEAKPYEIVGRLRDASAPGSYLAVSHARDARPDLTPGALEVYNRATASLALRTHAEIERFFDGYELLEPGLVYPEDWRPDAGRPRFPQTASVGYGGVGRKL
ncbi:SAM-dependent methyltransferase [Planotetraspora sp. GP83]|uniref:SAM-dependent methyltransferase n=1 Tax=Planotetraspora sp. GP83 TaxID=3156264 RepID=UPI003513B33C